MGPTCASLFTRFNTTELVWTRQSEGYIHVLHRSLPSLEVSGWCPPLFGHVGHVGHVGQVHQSLAAASLALWSPGPLRGMPPRCQRAGAGNRHATPWPRRPGPARSRVASQEAARACLPRLTRPALQALERAPDPRSAPSTATQVTRIWPCNHRLEPPFETPLANR